MSQPPFPNDPGLGVGVQVGLNQQPGSSLVDSAAWAQSASGLAVNLNGPTNQFALIIEANDTVASGAVASYEKAALLVIASTADVSGANTFDMVGVDSRGYIASTNTLGRAWGVYGEGRIVSGGVADGLIYGGEFQSINNGSDQATTATTTSKYGIHIIAGGANFSTAGIYLGGTPRGGGATTKWHKGLYMETASLAGVASDSFLELQSTWRVIATTGRVGATLIGTATPAFSTTMLEVAGAASAADPLVAIGNNTVNQPYSIRLMNASGAAQFFVATGGAFLGDTVLGDCGVRINGTASTAFRIGGTNTVYAVNQGNQHSFFNHAFAAQPTVTGALSTVTDAAAKAVLTSIIAAMSGCGFAVSGTT